MVLDSKSKRKFLLEDAKFIKEKVPEKCKRVIISRFINNALTAEPRTHQRRNIRAKLAEQKATPGS